MVKLLKAKYWYWIWRTFLGPSRLRKKFVRTFILAGLFPLLLMGGISYYLVNLTHVTDVATLEKNVASQTATEIKKNLDVAASFFDLRVTYEDFAPIDFTQQGFILQGVLKEIPSLTEASFICLTPGQCATGKETSRWLRNNGKLESGAPLRDRSADPIFLNTKNSAGNQIYFGPIVFGQPELKIPVAAKVLNKLSQPIAVVSGAINVSQSIGEIILDAKLGATGYVYVVDGAGAIIAHRNPELIGVSAASLPSVRAILKSDGGASQSFNYQSLTDQAVSGVGSNIENLKLAVIAEWPRQETQSLINAMLIQIGIFSLLSFIILAVISSWMALKLIEPIAQLRQATNVIGAGNFNYKIELKTGDELEDLGANLNKMAGNLKGLEQLNELKLRAELLSESLRKEQELSKIKDQFITTISHQLNTPLSVINWSVDALKDSEIKSKKVFDTAQIIAKSQREIAAIVADLVTLSDIGFRYKAEKNKPTDLISMVEKVIDSFKEALEIKKIKINFVKTATPAMANINEFTTRKAIENLIDNAIAYSNEKSLIEASVNATDKEIIIKVTDHGIGIPKDEQPLIFQQFFRAKNAVAKKNVGTGLGLFIAKTIIEGHGGRIWFISEENQGSSFFIALPKA